MNKTANQSRPFQALKEIKSAEDRARSVMQEAREKTSRKIIEDAHEDARKIRDSVLAEARKKAENKRNEIIHDAEKQAVETGQQAQSEMSSLKKKIQAHRQTAVKKTAETIRKRFSGEKD